MRGVTDGRIDPSALVVDSRSAPRAGTPTDACDGERATHMSIMPETPPTETFLGDRHNSSSPGLVQCIVSALTSRTKPLRDGDGNDDEMGEPGSSSSHNAALEKKHLEDELNIKMQEVFNLTAVVKQLSESQADALMARSDMCEKLSDLQREVMRMEHVVYLASTSSKESAASLREARQENKILRASLESVQRHEQYLMKENANLRRKLLEYENEGANTSHHADAIGMSAVRLGAGY